MKADPVIPPADLKQEAAGPRFPAKHPEMEAMAEMMRSTALLSPAQGTQAVASVIAGIARRTLRAHFTAIVILEQQEWLIVNAGEAPLLYASLNQGEAFFEQAVHSPYTFRQARPASDRRTAFLTPDSPELEPMLVCPIALKGEPVGLLMAFGKTEETAFNSSDVFLADLLALQAASLVESSRMYQELQNNLRTTQILYELTQHISQVEDLSDAAYVIAHTAHRLFQPESCGLLLFAQDGNKEAEARLPQKADTPYDLVQQVMESRQLIYLSEDENHAVVCVPVQTTRRCYGTLWMKIKEGPDSYQVPEKILHLMNQAVVALERSILLVETQQKSLAIEKAYHQQEESYERFLEALMELLEYRDGETEEHSKRVRELSEKLARSMGVSKAEMRALNQGAKLHDIGKIGVRDAVLLKKGPLNDEEWKEMRQHPTIGANVVQLISAYQDAIPIIYYHQERWDGSGYPMGLSGPNIPLLARIFAVVDVYDALTSDRPYRTRMKPIEALEYLESQAGVHFDPLVVEHMTRIIRDLEGLDS